MKVTLSEMKKNKEPTGVDEAENQINDLEHKEEKIFKENKKKKKNPKKNPQKGG